MVPPTLGGGHLRSRLWSLVIGTTGAASRRRRDTQLASAAPWGLSSAIPDSVHRPIKRITVYLFVGLASHVCGKLSCLLLTCILVYQRLYLYLYVNVSLMLYCTLPIRWGNRLVEVPYSRNRDVDCDVSIRHIWRDVVWTNPRAPRLLQTMLVGADWSRGGCDLGWWRRRHVFSKLCN